MPKCVSTTSSTLAGGAGGTARKAAGAAPLGSGFDSVCEAVQERTSAAAHRERFMTAPLKGRDLSDFWPRRVTVTGLAFRASPARFLPDADATVEQQLVS